MSILQRLFTREAATVEATAERTEAELRARLAEVQAAIAEGEGDVVSLLEEREGLTRAIEAASIARKQREQKKYRARIPAAADELRGRLNESLDELGDLVPRLLLACSHFTTIADEVQREGLGFEGGGLLEDHFGIPPDFGVKLIAAIRESAPRTEWDFAATGMLGKGVKADRPKIRPPQPIRVPRFQGDMAAPPGYSGVWPPEAYER
jgi:hypothetical protein